MKQKIINVSYRKESVAFPDWLKYEITILNENGTENLIPAYGKDLEDAISRVKHDRRVEIVEKTTRKIPIFFWLCMWVLYMTGITILQYELNEPMIIIGGLGFAGFSVILTQWWSQVRNVDKNLK
jgi:hypothetical protein